LQLAGRSLLDQAKTLPFRLMQAARFGLPTGLLAYSEMPRL
jgi:hypothetical protein